MRARTHTHVYTGGHTVTPTPSQLRALVKSDVHNLRSHNQHGLRPRPDSARRTCQFCSGSVHVFPVGCCCVLSHKCTPQTHSPNPIIVIQPLRLIKVANCGNNQDTFGLMVGPNGVGITLERASDDADFPLFAGSGSLAGISSWTTIMGTCKYCLPCRKL
jgi:hypothetical protein